MVRKNCTVCSMKIIGFFKLKFYWLTVEIQGEMGIDVCHKRQKLFYFIIKFSLIYGVVLN